MGTEYHTQHEDWWPYVEGCPICERQDSSHVYLISESDLTLRARPVGFTASKRKGDMKDRIAGALALADHIRLKLSGFIQTEWGGSLSIAITYLTLGLLIGHEVWS